MNISRAGLIETRMSLTTQKCRWRLVGRKGSSAAAGANLHLDCRALAPSILRGGNEDGRRYADWKRRAIDK